MKKLVISRCDEYNWEKIYNVILSQLSVLDISSKIKNKKVLLKPNLLSAHLPQEAVTTHPEFLRAVIKLFKERNNEVVVGDSPSTTNFDEVVSKTGIKKVCEEEQVELINLSTYPTTEFEFNKFGCKKLVVSKIVTEVDFVVNLPKLKTHSLTILTCGIKNMYGIVPGLTKSLYHKYAPHPSDFLEILYAVYSFRPPDLTIVDGIIGMDGEGPAGGNPKKFGLILTSEDATVIDYFVARSLFKLPDYLLTKNKYLNKPSEIVFLGVSNKEIESIEVALPQTISVINYFPKIVLDVIKPLIWFRPKIVQKLCKRCGKCYQICPQKTIKKIGGRYFIDYKNCITCFCCSETCPYKSIKIERSLLYKIFVFTKQIFKFLTK